MRSLLLATTLLLPTCAGAAEPPVQVLITGQKFVDEVRHGDEGKIMHAAGYMHAVQDMVSLQGIACMPADVTSLSLLRQLADSIGAKEDRARLPAVYFISRYIIETWPCPKEKAEPRNAK